MKKYEALIIFLSSMKDEAVVKALEQIRGEITKQGGTVKTVSSVDKRVFARPMKKKDNGQYVRVDFDLEPGSMAALQGRLKLNEDIFRIQIVIASPEIISPPMPKLEPRDGRA